MTVKESTKVQPRTVTVNLLVRSPLKSGTIQYIKKHLQNHPRHVKSTSSLAHNDNFRRIIPFKDKLTRVHQYHQRSPDDINVMGGKGKFTKWFCLLLRKGKGGEGNRMVSIVTFYFDIDFFWRKKVLITIGKRPFKVTKEGKIHRNLVFFPRLFTLYSMI